MKLFTRILGRRIYADWAATTPLHWCVARAMRKARKIWANPSAIYAEGVQAKKMLEAQREKVARLLSAKSDEIYFTSGGTEANNTIISGVIERCLREGVAASLVAGDIHVVSTAIEHSSVLETLRNFEGRGVRVTYVSPSADGIVRADDVLAAITPQTVLVTCMYVNNEIGTIQQISKIGAGIRKIRSDKVGKGAGGAVLDSAIGADFPVFHSDASQAPLWLSCDMEGLRVDALTLDAHKMQGPKGVGALVVRRHVKFDPLMTGGGQERGKRPTTESLVLVTGFAAALECAQNGREKRSDKARVMQKFFFKILAEKIPAAVVNGSTGIGHGQNQRIPNNINISLPDLDDPEFAVIKLDKAGIACSTKSSCLKGEEESYVVKAISGKDILGKDKHAADQSWRARNTLRFSFSPKIAKKQIEKIVDTIAMKVYNI